MANLHRPRRGSLAFSPRKRAKSQIPTVRSWSEGNKEPKLGGFAGYKVGMTHVIMMDDMPKSLTEGTEISVPVTVLEVPAMKIAAIRVYGETGPYGTKILGEAWSDDLDPTLDRKLFTPKKTNTKKALENIGKLVEEGKVANIHLISYTLPSLIAGIPKKKPDVMENRIVGGDMPARLEYATSLIGKSVEVSDVFNIGDMVDVLAITIGKGTQGPVKRWGINLMKNKHSRQGSLRQIGTLGPWNPSRVSWRVPQLGQTGYQQRTEYNKRIIKIGENGTDVTPKSGFLNYGEVSGNYLLLKGSVPGPKKRLIRLRPAIRGDKQPTVAPQVSYISVESKQG
ncbi:MAG TPA: 50S ribosomal protein L3 [Methanosarcinales archaeon]|nr:50S ribosomal protein L3 [Methanosarcinales archaeon]